MIQSGSCIARGRSTRGTGSEATCRLKSGDRNGRKIEGAAKDTSFLHEARGVSEEIQTVLPEFLPKGLHIIHIFSEFHPEVPAVVLHPSVDQFMEEDKIDQSIGEPGEFLVEADIVVRRAAPPAGLLISYGNPVEGKAVFPGKSVDAFPEKGLSLCPGHGSTS